MHLALARKYRPRLFADLVGQEHVARALKGAIEQNRVAHGYLLTGPRGVGKTTAARILAMALNCDTRHAGKSPGGEPCGTCTSCQRIWAGSASLDVVEIDAASNRGVDDARELRERAMYAASQEGRHKIYIVDEAHMLTREAWNALLKVLEEPPPGVVFVFATTEPQKITNFAAPVMSRLQRFDFRPVGPQAIAGRLAEVAAAEGVKTEPDAVELIARVANGGMRDALSVLDQVGAFGGGMVTAQRVREVLGLVGDDTFAELLAIVAQRRSAEVFPFVAKLVEGGVDIVTFADGAGDLWRAALAMRLGAPGEGISASLAQRIRADVESFQPGDLLRIMKSLTDAEEPLKRGSSPRLALETLLVRWTLMDRTVEIAELLGAGGRGPGAGDERPAAQRPAPTPAPQRPATAPVTRDVVAAPSVPTVPSVPSVFTLDFVRGEWPRVVDAIKSENKRLVAECVADTEPTAIDGAMIMLRHLGSNAMTPDLIGRNKQLIEAAASKVLGSNVKVALGPGSPGLGPGSPTHAGAPMPPEDLLDPAPDPRPPASASSDPRPPAPAVSRRLSPQGAKAERAKALRGKDPALDKAIEAMDLELLD